MSICSWLGSFVLRASADGAFFDNCDKFSGGSDQNSEAVTSLSITLLSALRNCAGSSKLSRGALALTLLLPPGALALTLLLPAGAFALTLLLPAGALTPTLLPPPLRPP